MKKEKDTMIAELKRKLATTLMEKSSLMAESVVTVEPTAMGDAMGDHVDEKDNIIRHLKTQVQFPHRVVNLMMVILLYKHIIDTHPCLLLCVYSSTFCK